MTPSDLRAWQAHMGYTYDTAAAALGVSRGTYADWLAGTSRTTGKPIRIKRTAALHLRQGWASVGLRAARRDDMETLDDSGLAARAWRAVGMGPGKRRHQPGRA